MCEGVQAMNSYTEWILFPSVTYANKARYYFGRAGISSHMERTPESAEGKGCGYRLAVKKEDHTRAYDICVQNGIRMVEKEEKR